MYIFLKYVTWILCMRFALGCKHWAVNIRSQYWLWTMEHFAHLLASNGEHALAISILQKSLRVRRVLQGCGHPDTIETASSLSGLLDANGQHDEANNIRRGRRSSTRRAVSAASSSTANHRGTAPRQVFDTWRRVSEARVAGRLEATRWSQRNRCQGPHTRGSRCPAPNNTSTC